MYKYSCQRYGLYFLLCIYLCGCSVMPPELETTERLIETAPDSALHILQHLPPGTYISGSDRALYGLLLVRALDRNMLPLKPDSLLDYSLNFYRSKHDYDHLAFCYLYKGRMYKSAFQYEKAMDYYLKALDAAQLQQDNSVLGRIYFDLGDIYNIQTDYGLARQKYRKAYVCFTTVKLQSQAFYSLLNIGRTYFAAGNYKNARDYYTRISSQAKDSLQKGALFQEMALNFFKYQKYDSAILYYRQLIHYPAAGNNRALRYYHLADLYFDLKQVDSASLYAGNAFNYNPDIRTRRECYRILVNAEYSNGNLKMFNHFMTKFQDCSDSIRKIDSQTKGSILETMHNTNQELSKNRNILWYLLVFFIVLITVGFLFYIRRIHRHKAERLLSEELHFKQKISIRKEVMLKHRESLLQKIEDVKHSQSVERKKAIPAERELMDRKLYEEFLHLNDVDFFHHEMDTVLNNLVGKLKSRYPALTHKEINWCCLHLLQIPTTDIYMLLDYKVDSLKKMRQRLAQKISLPGVAELDDFLIELISE